jgi:hypothetical protein
VCKNQKKNLQIVNKIEILFRVEVITQNTEGALDSQPQVIKVYQLLAQGWWFSLGTPASSTTKNWSP